MSLEEKVINKLGDTVSKKLDEAFTHKEDLDSYMKRTMHGKLTKKVINKKLKSKGIDGKEIESKDTELDDTYLKELGYKKSQGSIFQLYDIIIVLSVVLLVMAFGYLTSDASVERLLLAGILFSIMLYSMLIPLKFKYNKESIYDPTDDEKEILEYNQIYLYNNQYVRFYEIKNYENINEYIKAKKVKPQDFSKGLIEGIKISKPLTYNEIQEYKLLYEKGSVSQESVKEEKAKEKTTETSDEYGYK